MKSLRKVAFILFVLFGSGISCTVVDTELMELVLEIKNQNEELLTEVKSLQAKSDSLVNEIKKSAAKQEELLKKVTDLQAELAKVLSQVGSLNEQLKGQDADLDAIKAQLADLQKKYEGILVQLEQLQKLGQILAEIEKLKAQLTDLNGKYQVVVNTLAQNQQAQDALKSQVSALQSQLAQNLEKISQLTSQLGEQGADIEKILTQIQELKASIEEIKTLLGNQLTGKSPVPTNGLVGWWPFNGNANDESESVNNGVVIGANLSTDRSGNLNSAYSFNGLSWIQSSAIGLPTGNNPRSISIWYKSIDLGISDGKGSELFGYGGTICGNNVIMIFDNPDIGNNYQGKIEIQGHCNLFKNFTQQPIPNNNRWYNITITYDGNKLSFYYNGILSHSVSNVLMNTNSSSNSILTIGKVVSPTGNTPYTIDRNQYSSFSGEIDDIALWNRALTADEVSKIYKGEGF